MSLHRLTGITIGVPNVDETVGYYEQALVLDPRNIELLTNAAANYSDLRKFEAALKLCDRALDIQPNDSGLMAFKAGIYQGQGNLEEAAKLLTNPEPRLPEP